MAKGKGPKIIELSGEELDGLSERLESGNISASDCRKLKALILVYRWLIRLLEVQKLSIKRLKCLFSIKTEKSKKILKESKLEECTASKESECGKGSKGSGLEEECKKIKGHGRNGVSAYQNVERVKIEHEQNSLYPQIFLKTYFGVYTKNFTLSQLKVGANCPECPKGKLYGLKKPAYVIRLTGPVT
jgi:hypothetical protein